MAPNGYCQRPCCGLAIVNYPQPDGTAHLLHEVPLGGDNSFTVFRRVGRPGCLAPILIHDELPEPPSCATPTSQPSTAP